MRYWLVKSEPEAYGWSHLLEEGEAVWDGVRNYQARNFLREMAVEDRVLFYHSGKSREIVGVTRVTQGPFPDPTDDTGKWTAVAIVAEEQLAVPVALAQLKADPELEGLLFLRQSRLSVSPVSASEFRRILQYGKEPQP